VLLRYLILSDIHANLTALNAALEAAKGRWDRVVCLGDIVDYGPDPNESIDRVRALKPVTIRGNHDKAVVGLIGAEDFNPLAQAAVVWTRDQLRPANRAYLEALPQGPLGIGGFTIVHGSLHDEDEYVFAPSQARDGLVNSPTQVMFFGHTHIQGAFFLRGEEVDVLNVRPALEQSRWQLTIEPGSTYLLNPGSIGQPRDDDPRCAFAIADIEKESVEFWRIPYDVEAVQNRMVDAGLPEPLILRLSFGR
jgi:predicted phosphodiesterase